MSDLAHDLRATTVAISYGDRIGTGFFVGQDLLVTCAHIFGEGPPEGTVDGEWSGLALRFRLEPSTWRKADDLVLLRLADTGERRQHPWVCWSGEMAAGDELGVFGHPLGLYRAGDSVRLVYDGVSFHPDGTELHRATQGRATHGFSGSPVINWRTGGICGMLRRADSPAGGPPGVRIVPAETILNAYPNHINAQLTRDSLERTWLPRLSDEMLRAGRWRYPGPRLRAYLEAICDAAADHPYAFARRGAPKLNTVYLRQQFRADTGSDERSVAVTVDEAMTASRDGFVVLGDPGAGKSSLLRHLTETFARNWLEGDLTAGFVPVHVSAESMVGARQLADGLADGLVSTVGIRLNDPNPAELFRQEPIAGVPWLVLIDGVDEVLDPEDREKLLKDFHYWRRTGGEYRLVLASRPLPDTDTHELRRGNATVYEIQPFTPEQLPEFAERWFTALGVPDPADVTRRFQRQLATSRLLPLAQLPLIATMICVVFAENADRELPHSRVELYRRFVEILLDKPYSQLHMLQRLEKLVYDYGPVARAAVEKLLAELQPMLVEIALQRQDGSPDTLLDLAGRRFNGHLPPHLPTKLWGAVLRDALAQSGLVIQRAGELNFMHYTVQEFLAAQGFVGDRQPTTEDARHLVETVAARSQSYALFIAGLWTLRRPDWSREIADVALGEDGPWHVEFFAELIREGVPLAGGLADEVVQRMTIAVEDESGYHGARVRAFDALSILDPDEARRLLGRLGAAGVRYTPTVIEFAEALTRGDTAETATVLEAVVLDEGLQSQLRRWALEQYDRKFPVQGIALHRRLVLSKGTESAIRRVAGEQLLRGTEATHIDLVRRIASDPDDQVAFRLWAATRLERIDRDLANDLIAALAGEEGIPQNDRLLAIYHLAVRGDPRARDLLAAMTTNGDTGGPILLRALLDLGHTTVAGADRLLQRLARDRKLAAVVRIHAAAALRDIDAAASADILGAIAADPTLGITARFEAADELFWSEPESRRSALVAIAVDESVDDAQRARAAIELAGFDFGTAEAPLRRLGGTATDPAVRVECLVTLAEHRASEAEADGRAFVVDPKVSFASKRDYARSVAAHLPDLSADLFAEWTRDPGLTPADRWALAQDAGPATVAVLTDLVHDPTMDAGTSPTRLPLRFLTALKLFELDLAAGTAAMRTLARADGAVADHALAWLIDPPLLE